MKVTDLMKKNVHTTLLEDTLQEAAETMLKRDVGVLPVVDEQDRLVGMITDRDICMCSLIEGRSLQDLPVSLAMSSPAWACGLEDSLEDVHAAMQTHQIHRVPVVDGDEKVVGIVGVGDIVRATAAKKRGANPTDLIRTLGLVTEPREIVESRVAGRTAGRKDPT